MATPTGPPKDGTEFNNGCASTGSNGSSTVYCWYVAGAPLSTSAWLSTLCAGHPLVINLNVLVDKSRVVVTLSLMQKFNPGVLGTVPGGHAINSLVVLPVVPPVVLPVVVPVAVLLFP